MAEPRRLLPDIPDDVLPSPEERARRRARESNRRRTRAGFVQVGAVIHRQDVDYLMTEWGFETQAQMVRVALRYLEAHTRAGLTQLSVRDEYHNGDARRGGSSTEPPEQQHFETSQER